jgi:hypothetical protein
VALSAPQPLSVDCLCFGRKKSASGQEAQLPTFYRDRCRNEALPSGQAGDGLPGNLTRIDLFAGVVLRSARTTLKTDAATEEGRTGRLSYYIVGPKILVPLQHLTRLAPSVGGKELLVALQFGHFGV